jgi:hypothetical protein
LKAFFKDLGVQKKHPFRAALKPPAGVAFCVHGGASMNASLKRRLGRAKPPRTRRPFDFFNAPHQPVV